ncbi:hypothetical protein CCHR01_03497 [Colletotrichum chrysophilum]|uniref:Secreted protein n=1 Tax=Colletotrichum chrysophilum TaxID=1836956 RepID=A0AAD9EJB8_9PEZI|nr:hypothetical protein CCHR01_03497 [Colletotrichum chrysophilum]
MSSQKSFLAFALASIFLFLSCASASPLPISPDDAVNLKSRQSVCRPIVGCVPFFNAPTWNSFELTIPAPGDPLTQEGRSAGGEVEASVWNRADGSAFLGIHLGDDYDLPAHAEMQIQARFRNTDIRLNRASIDLEGQGALGTIPAASITEWRQGNRIGNTITLTIRWRLNQDL